jgi:hypothetical protein
MQFNLLVANSFRIVRQYKKPLRVDRAGWRQMAVDLRTVIGCGRKRKGLNSRDICLEGLRKVTEYPSQRNWEPDRDTRPGLPEYKAGVSAVRFINWYPSCKSVIVSLLNLQWKHDCDAFKLVCSLLILQLHCISNLAMAGGYCCVFTARFNSEQNRRFTYNMTSRRVLATFVAVEKQ